MQRTSCCEQQRPDRVALRAEAAKVAEAVQLVAVALAGVVQQGAQRVRVGVHAAEHGDPRHPLSIVVRRGPDEIRRGADVTRIAILGAGPIGLEAALAAAARGDDFTVLEAAPTVGGYVRRWGHVRTFTPWDMNVSPRMRAALPDAPRGAGLPTGAELAEQLLEPVAALPALRGRIRCATRVLAVGREGLLKHEAIGQERRARRPFRLLVLKADGRETIVHADVVLDATGTYGSPNRLGDGGIAAVNEGAFDDRIERFLPAFDAEHAKWAGRTILLTGAGHCAQTAARALARFARDAPGTQVVWAVRNPAPDWGAVAGDPLPERAALNAAAARLAAGASDAVTLRAGHVTEALHPAATAAGSPSRCATARARRSRSTASSRSTAASAITGSTASSRSTSATRPAGR